LVNSFVFCIVYLTGGILALMDLAAIFCTIYTGEKYKAYDLTVIKIHSDVEKIPAIINSKELSKLFHLVVPDGVDSGQVGGKHIDLCRLFNGLN
jgi:hypothetical protein